MRHPALGHQHSVEQCRRPLAARREDEGRGGRGKGAGIGAAVGGVGGLLTGLGLMAIPGVGQVVAAGWLAATAAGAATGAVEGGAARRARRLTHQRRRPAREAQFYAEGVRRGGTLVSARVDDEQAPLAREILQRYKAVDPAVRGATYRESGRTAFDNARQPTRPRKSLPSGHGIFGGGVGKPRRKPPAC